MNSRIALRWKLALRKTNVGRSFDLFNTLPILHEGERAGD